MAQLTIEINGKSYAVGCEDGQEAHLKNLAAMVDGQVRQVSHDVGQLGETRLMLMGALLVADELAAAKVRMVQLEAELSRLKDEGRKVEEKAAAALHAVADKLNTLATD